MYTTTMLIIFTRAIIIYVFLLIAMRLMGKKQLGELQPFEFAITLIVAEIACIPMSDSTVPIVYGLVPIFTLFVLHLIVTKLVKHSIKLRRIINGKPVIVIDSEGINFKAIKMLDMTVNDLFESLRASGCFTPADVRYAIVETNGDLTVMLKSEATPVTNGDLGLNIDQKSVPFMIICEGKLLEQNLQASGLDKSLIDSILDRYMVKQKDILLLSVQGGQDIYLQAKHKPCIITTVEDIESDNQELSTEATAKG